MCFLHLVLLHMECCSSISLKPVCQGVSDQSSNHPSNTAHTVFVSFFWKPQTYFSRKKIIIILWVLKINSRLKNNLKKFTHEANVVFQGGSFKSHDFFWWKSWQIFIIVFVYLSHVFVLSASFFFCKLLSTVCIYPFIWPEFIEQLLCVLHWLW